uniref:Aspartate ammonia-lyase n=1 Tax=Amphora coffeiformis TaxID=265554 RepID=A0A7S3P9P3_9STRA|mmetsp:Transcript_9640/g.18409  ORF Transcript_9640/g.18409 Transcript_9640/m.18409 type:complete len:536 (-) Transcript_9640:168-1775(-)|eukprot:scaffold7832_cov164-Amphora_coffeaeformis.AAC.5
MVAPPPPPTKPATTADDGFRMEHDLLGDEQVPNDCYYGIQTMRAIQNFDITGVPIGHFPQLIRALAMVKKACALANHELGNLDKAKKDAIVQAADEIINGALLKQFPVDLIQGGAGTSTNMNMNEVIANRGLELMGHQKGEYHYLHPNNDVNMSQSTNDVYPTACRLAIVFSDDPLIESVRNLMKAMNDKAEEFKDVLKLGRTQLQDAVPMTLGVEFHGWSLTLGKDLDRMENVAQQFSSMNLGGTAIGTGINTDERYTSIAIKKLSEVTGVALTTAPSLVEATSDMGDFMSFSSMLRRLAVKLSKISNDLRLLSSGPRGGINDINLPPMQPGSSIMPGKVNPVIPEAVNQVCFQVIGNDLAVHMASEAGQLQLNAFEPVIIYNILSSLRMMTNATNMLAERCICGITANTEHCERTVRESIGIVTAFSPFLGYEKSTALARQALATGRNVIDLIKEEHLLSDTKIDSIMTPANLTGPSSLLSDVKVKNADRSNTHLRNPSTVPLDQIFGPAVVAMESPRPPVGHRKRPTAQPSP